MVVYTISSDLLNGFNTLRSRKFSSIVPVSVSSFPCDIVFLLKITPPLLITTKLQYSVNYIYLLSYYYMYLIYCDIIL